MFPGIKLQGTDLRHGRHATRLFHAVVFFGIDNGATQQLVGILLYKVHNRIVDIMDRASLQCRNNSFVNTAGFHIAQAILNVIYLGHRISFDMRMETMPSTMVPTISSTADTFFFDSR